MRMAFSKQTIRDDLTAAMKARDSELTATLRMLLAAVGNAEVAGKEQVALSEEQLVNLVRAETKKRNESATLYANAGRQALADNELAEVAILARYLPAAMPDSELTSIVATAIADAAAQGHTGPKAMGIVMKAVKEKAGGTVDGGRMSAVVKTALGT